MIAAPETENPKRMAEPPAYDICDKNRKPLPAPEPAPEKSRKRGPSGLPYIPAPAPGVTAAYVFTGLSFLVYLFLFAF